MAKSIEIVGAELIDDQQDDQLRRSRVGGGWCRPAGNDEQRGKDSRDQYSIRLHRRQLSLKRASQADLKVRLYVGDVYLGGYHNA
jgi:hypothetical protein